MSDFHEIAARKQGYLDRADAAASDLSQHQIDDLVKANHWQRPHAGVYLTGSAPPNWNDKVRAACMASGGDVRAMGRTGARVRGLDGAERNTVIEVTVSYTREPEPAGVIVRRTRRPGPVDYIGGIPVDAIERVLLDYAWLVRSDIIVERAVEHAIDHGMTSEEALVSYLRTCGRGVKGVTRLRRVLANRAEGRAAKSGFEVVVFDILRRYDLPLPIRRPLVSVPPDRKYELDLAYVAEKIDLEPMGKRWHMTSQRRRANAERRRVLGGLGWQVLPVFWEEATMAPWSVADRTRQALDVARARNP